MKWFKRGLLALFVFLIFIVGAAYVFFPSEKIAREAERELSEFLNAEVKVGGVRPKLIGVKLSQLSLKNIEAVKGNNISVASIDLNIGIMSLFKRQIRVTSLTIDQPNIEYRLVESSQKSSAQNAESKSRSDIDPSSQPEDDWELEVDEFRIDNGQLVIREGKETLVELRGINEKLRIRAESDELLLKGVLGIEQFWYRSPMGQVGRGESIRWEKELRYTPTSDRLTISQSDLRVADLPVAVSGKIDKAQSDRPELDLNFSGGPAEVKNILAFLPSALFPGQSKTKGQGNIELKGFAKGPLDLATEGEMPWPEFDLQFTLKNGSLEYPKFGKTIRDIQIAIGANPKVVEIEKLKAQTEKSSFDVSGKVSNYLTKPNLALNVDSKLDIEELSQIYDMGDVQSSGVVRVNAKLRGVVDAPEMDGYTEFSDVSWDDQAYPAIRNVNGRIGLKNGSASISELRANLGKSDLRINGQITELMPFLLSESDGFGFDLKAEGKNFDADEWLPAEDTDADEDEVVDLGFLKPFRGKASMQYSKITYHKTAFKNAKGTLHFKGDEIVLKPFSMDSLGGAIGLNGTLNIRDAKKPEFDFNLDLRNIKVEQLFAFSPSIKAIALVENYFTGSFSSEVSMKGMLTPDFGVSIPSLFSKGTLKFSQAKMQGHPVQNLLAKTLNNEDVKKLSFKKWVQPFEIREGALHVKNLSFGTSDLGAQISGSQRVDGSLDYAMDLKIPKSMLGALGNKIPSALLKTDGSQLELPFTIGGQMTSPKLDLKEKVLATYAKEQAKSQFKSKLESQVKPKVKKELKENAKKILPTKKLEKKIDKDKVKDRLKKLF